MKRCFLFLVSMCLLIGDSWAVDFANIPKLVVRGEASIFKPSDQMEVSLGVVTTAENSTQALNENNKRMHQIIANLQELGLNENDYQTGRFHIYPIYQKPPKDSDEDERTKISHYEVINAIQIKTQKIDLADKIIAVAVQGGANQVDQVNFNLTKPEAYRAEAIQAAAQNALADANALANAVGIKLKRVLSVSLDHWQQLPRPMMLVKQSVMDNSASEQVFESGKAQIHAAVNVTFEVE